MPEKTVSIEKTFSIVRCHREIQSIFFLAKYNRAGANSFTWWDLRHWAWVLPSTAWRADLFCKRTTAARPAWFKRKDRPLKKAQIKYQIGSRRLDLKFVSFEFGRKLQLLTWEYPHLTRIEIMAVCYIGPGNSNLVKFQNYFSNFSRIKGIILCLFWLRGVNLLQKIYQTEHFSSAKSETTVHVCWNIMQPHLDNTRWCVAPIGKT
jgi:hypothetical protein